MKSGVLEAGKALTNRRSNWQRRNQWRAKPNYRRGARLTNWCAGLCPGHFYE